MGGVITLTTEWRSDDFYSGLIKGRIYSLDDRVVVVDNATAMPPLNVTYASFVVRHTYSSYPAGSVHILCVSTEVTPNNPIVALKFREHYFIGTDSGIFSLLLEDSMLYEAAVIELPDGANELLTYAEIAVAIINGKKIGELGTVTTELIKRIPFRATISDDAIIGNVIYVDSYGNSITNISRKFFEEHFKGGDFNIRFQGNRNPLEIIREGYNDVEVSDLLVRFNSLDLLEIAIHSENVAQLYNLDVNQTIRVERKRPQTIF